MKFFAVEVRADKTPVKNFLVKAEDEYRAMSRLWENVAR